MHPTFANGDIARQVLNDAEDELRAWQPSIEPIHSNAGSLGAGAMPGNTIAGSQGYGSEAGLEANLQEHPAYREKSSRSRSGSGEGHGRVVSGESTRSHEGGEVQPPYPMTEAERRQVAEAGVI